MYEVYPPTTNVILLLMNLCFLKMSTKSVTSLKKKPMYLPTYIKIMIIKLKTRWEAFLICKNNQPKVLFIFFFFLST